MNLLASQEELAKLARDSANKWLKLKQLSARLRDLKPYKLAALTRKFRRHETAQRAERLAYLDDGYQKYINEYVELNQDKERLKVDFETHRMLFQARQSLRLWELEYIALRARQRSKNKQDTPT